MNSPTTTLDETVNVRNQKCLDCGNTLFFEKKPDHWVCGECDMNATTPALDEAAKFWSKVEKTDGCWNWRGTITKFGYGRFYINKQNLSAHRYSYSKFKEPIPAGLCIDHICRNRKCVRPDHLRAVTIRTNCLENSISLVAIHAAKTHCIRGHELTGKNITIRFRDGTPRRQCKSCKAIREKRYRANGFDPNAARKRRRATEALTRLKGRA